MKYKVKLDEKELFELQRADYEVSGIQVLIREFVADPTIVGTLIPKYQDLYAALRKAQFEVYKNHPEIPFDANLNFDFRDGIAYWGN
jgi:hypothetical protein